MSVALMRRDGKWQTSTGRFVIELTKGGYMAYVDGKPLQPKPFARLRMARQAVSDEVEAERETRLFELNRRLHDTRSPIERMVDEACGNLASGDPVVSQDGGDPT